MALLWIRHQRQPLARPDINLYYFILYYWCSAFICILSFAAFGLNASAASSVKVGIHDGVYHSNRIGMACLAFNIIGGGNRSFGTPLDIPLVFFSLLSLGYMAMSYIMQTNPAIQRLITQGIATFPCACAAHPRHVIPFLTWEKSP
jgi:hypothetical protein